MKLHYSHTNVECKRFVIARFAFAHFFLSIFHLTIFGQSPLKDLHQFVREYGSVADAVSIFFFVFFSSLCSDLVAILFGTRFVRTIQLVDSKMH